MSAATRIERILSKAEELITNPKEEEKVISLLEKAYEIFCENSSDPMRYEEANDLYDLHENLGTYYRDRYEENDAGSMQFLANKVQEIKKLLLKYLEKETEEESACLDENDSDTDDEEIESVSESSQNNSEPNEDEEQEIVYYKESSDEEEQESKREFKNEARSHSYFLADPKTILLNYKTRLKEDGLSSLTGIPLSKFNCYLSKHLLEDGNDHPNAETYHRSELHPFSKNLNKIKEIPKLFYPSKKLENGERAHVGGYANPMHIIEGQQRAISKSTQSLIKNKKKTTSGDGQLYDSLIGYKNELCQYIMSHLTQTKILKVGFYNRYPCVMVFINKTLIAECLAIPQKNISNASFESWVDAIGSYFTGLVNFIAFVEALPIELVRRSSFGFSTPTIAPTGSSFRINIGIAPKCYADILIRGLAILDEVLYSLFKEQNNIQRLPHGMFYESEAYKKYLAKAKKSLTLDRINPLKISFEKTDSKGNSCIYNIMRTSYARDGISAEVFKFLKKTVLAKQPLGLDGCVNAFFAGFYWALGKLKINAKNKLEFQQDIPISYEKKFNDSPTVIQDEKFWQMILLIIERIVPLRNPTLHPALEALISYHKNKNITGLFSCLEFLNELLFVDAIDKSHSEDYENLSDSDSEEEGEINGKPALAKKLIVHNGMRAIWSALISVARTLARENIVCKVYIENSYYEVNSGIKDIIILESLQNVSITRNPEEANIVIYDLNGCVTHGGSTSQNNFLESLKNKVKFFILDMTSATQDQVQHYTRQLFNGRLAIFVVSSGFKHEQLGSDKNPYGTVRIVSSKDITNLFYENIKEHEPRIFSKASRIFRRSLKQVGGVPTNAEMFFNKRKSETLLSPERFQSKKLRL